jgi:hypothetical protein
MHALLLHLCSSSNCYSAFHISPAGALLTLFFQHDMILNIPLIKNLLLIHQHRQVIIDERLRGAKFHHHFCDYKVLEMILFDNHQYIMGKGIYYYSNAC